MNRYLVFFCCFSSIVNAKSFTDYECFKEAGEYYGVNSLLLYSIAEVESSFNSLAINSRKSDEDVGLMQINSWWFGKLSKYGITRDRLLNDPCLNVHVGAYILSESISFYGQTWRAVGAYDAGTKNSEEAELVRESYARRVRTVYQRNLGAGMRTAK